MTDRELLEAAAKAAGIVALRAPDGSLRDCTGFDPAMNIFAAPHWNPLTDDGDALRLAVTLRLCTNAADGGFCAWTLRPGHHEAYHNHAGNEMSAARRAIVRAAAALAKGNA